MPCIFGIIGPTEECRGTECQSCTGWDTLCAGCGESCRDSLCPACEAQLQRQPTGWEQVARVVAALLLALLLAANAQAKHRYKEEYYQKKWCEAQGGTTEYILPDRTRVDCLTKTHAVEFDFGPKAYESVGQSLWYSLNTGKKAGIVLILENPGDNRYWERLNAIVDQGMLPIDTWMMEGE